MGQFIVKGGDSLIKELLVIQVIALLQDLFAKERLSVYLQGYEIYPLGNGGLIEYLQGISIDALKAGMGPGMSAEHTLTAHFREVYGEAYGVRHQQAMKRFIGSLVGYSLLTYVMQVRPFLCAEKEGGGCWWCAASSPFSCLFSCSSCLFSALRVPCSLCSTDTALSPHPSVHPPHPYLSTLLLAPLSHVSPSCFQVKDRHNANILLTPSGALVHLDFGYLLGESPRSINFENAPFKFTREYLHLLGGVDSAAMREFEDLFVKGFVCLQRNIEGLLAIIQVHRAFVCGVLVCGYDVAWEIAHLEACLCGTHDPRTQARVGDPTQTPTAPT